MFVVLWRRGGGAEQASPLGKEAGRFVVEKPKAVPFTSVTVTQVLELYDDRTPTLQGRGDPNTIAILFLTTTRGCKCEALALR